MDPADLLRTAAAHVRRDYLGRDRRDEYVGLLRGALDAGYELVSMADFHARSSRAEPMGRVLVLRHDVDIRDVAGNEAFHAVELGLGARSTFYFRRSTVKAHAALVERLLRDGFEVGYHFEEAATVAKAAGLTDRASVEGRRDEIAELFRRNCATFRKRWNPDLTSVASHGDWINRRLGFANHEFVDAGSLAANGLQFEAYGDDILGKMDVYVSDVAMTSQRWARDYGLDLAVRDGRSPICMLTHERNWHTSLKANLFADVDRVADTVAYRWRRRRPRPGSHG